MEWLKEGDSNSKFFHGRAIARKRKNKISKLKKEDGGWDFDRKNTEGNGK